MGDINIKFPIGGIHEGAPFTEQPPSTTSDALNVTGQDPVSGRTRGAQRAGMSKYNPNAVGANKIALIQGISYDSSPASITAYASGSENTSWAKTLPGKASVFCMATDPSNNVYVVDSGADIVKYNPTGYQLYTYKVPVKDEGHEIRAIAIDQANIIYVAVSAGGQQNTAHIFAFEEIEGTSGQYLEKIWEYKTERYISKLVYSSGNLYAALNDTSLSESAIIVLSNVGTAVPTLDKEIVAPYPVYDIAISPKDGGIVSTSPINTSRGGDRLINTSFKSPRSIDWDPSKLEGFDKRVWAWLDASDIDGDGTANSAYSDGEEITLWTDKSGNGRNLFAEPLQGYIGPLLSKKGFGGRDCLSFSGTDTSGNPASVQYLVSGLNGQNTGTDTAAASNNPQNLGLIPTHQGASYAMFIVFEAIDDGVNPQHVFSQKFSGFTSLNSDLSAEVGVISISALHDCRSDGSISYAGLNASSTKGYSPGVCTVLGFGGSISSSDNGESFGVSFAGTPPTQDYFEANRGAGLRPTPCPSGKSKTKRFLVSLIVRAAKGGSSAFGFNDGENREPVLHGQSAVSSPGYQTTPASYCRINGNIVNSLRSLYWYSGEKAYVGKLAPSTPYTKTAAASSFKGRVCEILVLKEWYYKQDETSSPVRLNVCSSRPPKYTTGDHGEYSSSDYLQSAGDGAGASGLTDESALSGRIYESELIEGYLAHKWGMADELPSELVGYIIVNGSAAITSGNWIDIPIPGGSHKRYTFSTSTSSPTADKIYIPPGGAIPSQLKAQAIEIYKAINGLNATLPQSPAEHFYAMPPTLDGEGAATLAYSGAIIEIRTRSSMAETQTSASLTGIFVKFLTNSAVISFKGYAQEYTNSTNYDRFVSRTKMAPQIGGVDPGVGINYSVHPFAESRRQVHASYSDTQAGWTIRRDYVARTLGGPPRSDGKRKYQPLQVLSSSSQNIIKYGKSFGDIKWSLYNGSPEGVSSGGSYAGYGGIGFSVSINSDGLIYSSGQRSVQQSYPSYTEHTRLGLYYPGNSFDVRATNDAGASSSLAWQKQITATTGLDDTPGWARSVVDEKKNLVLPVLDQESTLASVIVYRPSDGTELHRHVLNTASDQYQVGLSAGASASTVTLPSSFTDPRSEYIYLGTRCDNTSIVTFTVQPTATETITLADGSDTRTYTFVTSASGANQVERGASLADAIANLRGAINGTAGAYGAGTAINSSVVVRHSTATQLYLASRVPEPSGGTGVFTFATTTTAIMSAVQFRDACLRRINLVNVAPSGSSTSFRSIKNISVDGDGKVYSFSSSGLPVLATGTSFTATNSKYYSSAVLYQKVYITNGFQAIVYDPVLNTTSNLESKQGGSPTERWALVSSWRGRLVLGRSISSPHNWIMSAIGDPTNWDLFPPVVSPGQAVSGTISRAGLVPDVVNALIPYNDDLMLFGGDHSIYRLTGDPMSGGQMDLVTDVTGIAFGHAWDKDPQGVLYFMSSRGALYAWPPGGRIVELSLGKFEQRLSQIDFSSMYTQLVWNDMDRTLHVFTMPFGSSTATARHFRYERDSKAFWEDSYGSYVTAAAVIDGDNPNDRKLLIGSGDNIIRQWDSQASDDDGVAIDSYVTFGPFGSQDAELRLSMIQAVLAENQSGAHVQLFASDTPDVLGDPIWAGKLTSGRNPNMFTRVRGSYFWIRLRNSAVGERWAFENMTVRVAQAGRRRVR